MEAFEAVFNNDYLTSGIIAAAGTWAGGMPPACVSRAFRAASDAGGFLGSILLPVEDGHESDNSDRRGVIADMCSRIPGVARRMVTAAKDALVPLVTDYDSARHVYLCGLHALFGTCTRDDDAGVLEDVRALLDGWPWQVATRFRLDDLTRGDLHDGIQHRAFDFYENGWDVLGYVEYAMMWLAQAGRMEALIGLLGLDRDGELHRGHRGVLRLCMLYTRDDAADCILRVGFEADGAYEDGRGEEVSSYLMHRLMCNAAEHGSLEAVRMCMAHPDYVSHPAPVCDAAVTYAFLKAVEGGHEGVVRELLQRGADAGVHNGEALSMAASKGDAVIVRMVLTAPRNPPRADCQKSQIAFWALWKGHAEVARTLLTWPEHPARLSTMEVHEIMHKERTVAIDVLKQIDGLREVVDAYEKHGWKDDVDPNSSPPRQRRRLTPTKTDRTSSSTRPLPNVDDILLGRVETRGDRTYADAFRYEPRPGGDFDIYEKLDGTLFACVRDSQIPGAGKGLYTCRDLKKDDPVGLYCGYVVGWDAADAADGCGASNAYQITHTVFIDGETNERWVCLVDGARPVQPEHEQRKALNLTPDYPVPFDPAEWPGAYMHLINDANGPCKVPGLANNVRFEEDGMVVATAPVPGSHNPDAPMDPRSELLCGYGAAYWAKR